jgi:hypothetical protein
MPLPRPRFATGVVAAIIMASGARAFAQTATLAPADETFGRFNLSVLGIANAIRDCGDRIDGGADARALITGPLAFATDAIHAWETRYPGDPWIAKDLLALETVYIKIPTSDALHLAASTEAWLLADFPSSPYGAKARALLDTASTAAPAQTPPSGAWERFAALRAPLPPGTPR